MLALKIAPSCFSKKLQSVRCKVAGVFGAKDVFVRKFVRCNMVKALGVGLVIFLECIDEKDSSRCFALSALVLYS